MRSQTTRTISGRVNSDGTIAAGGEFTARRIGLGAYTLTFKSSFRLIGCTFTGISQQWGMIYGQSFTDTSCTVNFSNQAVTAQADTAFAFTATGMGV